jgi:hypothetical protein
MKIIESQNALLSNFEVYQHIADQRARNKAQNRRVPANAHHVMNEVRPHMQPPRFSANQPAPRPGQDRTQANSHCQVVTYLSRKPSPLEKQDETKSYSPAAIGALLARLREANLPGELTKGELLSILNLRPTSNALLSAAVEDLEERFSEEDQSRIVDLIGEVLGPAETGEGGVGDEEMEADAVPSVENGY